MLTDEDRYNELLEKEQIYLKEQQKSTTTSIDLEDSERK